MNNEQIIISPFRIIPCDLGHQIEEDLLKKIRSYLESSEEWDILSEIEGEEVLFAKARMENEKLYFHLYSDGIGIFTLMDDEEKYASYKQYKPENTNIRKKICHEQILKHEHSVSRFIDKYIEGLRALFNKRLIRFSASSTWENAGLSYIMSFYFITIDLNALNDEIFQRKLAVLLFPYYNETKDVDSLTKSGINSTTGKFTKEFLEVVKHDYEILPYLHTCASWSSLLIIGEVSDRIKKEYWKLERDLQHIWFYTYITDIFIEKSLKDICTDTPERELDKLNSILTDMIFKINKYESIISSTLHDRDFRLYEALRKTSRLDLLVESVRKKANLLKDRDNWLLNEKRVKADKKIQFILFLIAIISTVGAYKSFIELGTYSVLIAILSIVGGLYFFKPFLFYKKQKERR